MYPNQAYFEVKFNPPNNIYNPEEYVDEHNTLLFKGAPMNTSDLGAQIPISFDNIKQINKLPDSIETLKIYNTKIINLPKNLKKVYSSNFKFEDNLIKNNLDSQIEFVGISHYNDSDGDY